MVHRFKSTLSHLLRVHTGRRQLSDQSNWLTKIGLSKTAGPFEPTRQSERLVDATARLRLICKARSRPPDEQLLERRTGLGNRAVVAPRECPILESLTSRAALFDIRVGGRRRHDDVREALRDYDGSLYRTVRRVLLKPSLKRLVRTRRQCWTVERRRQCLDAFRIRGRDELA